MHGKALWEVLSYPPKTLKLRLARDIIAGGGIAAGSSERSDNEDEGSSDDAYEEEEIRIMEKTQILLAGQEGGG